MEKISDEVTNLYNDLGTRIFLSKPVSLKLLHKTFEEILSLTQ